MIRLVAALAIVPLSVRVDPCRRALVTRKPGAAPPVKTGGLSSTARRALIVAGSTANVAAFARSALPASSSSHTRTRCGPSGMATAFTRAIPGPLTTPLTTADRPAASHTSKCAESIGRGRPLRGIRPHERVIVPSGVALTARFSGIAGACRSTLSTASPSPPDPPRRSPDGLQLIGPVLQP